MNISRKDIISYLENENLSFVEDSTNRENIYRRNLIRNELMPKLEDLNPGFTKTISQTSVLLSEDEMFLDAIAENFLTQNGGESLSISKLKGLPMPILRRVIRKFAGAELSFEHVNDIVEQLEGEGLRSLDLPGMSMRFQYDSLSIGQDQAELKTRVLNPDEQEKYYIEELDLEIGLKRLRSYKKQIETKNQIVFNSEEIYGKIFLTTAKSGDKLRLSRRKVSKKISDLYSEAKMDLAERRLCPVLRDEKGPFFVYGFDKAERVEPKNGKPALAVEFIFQERKGENLS